MIAKTISIGAIQRRNPKAFTVPPMIKKTIAMTATIPRMTFMMYRPFQS